MEEGRARDKSTEHDVDCLIRVQSCLNLWLGEYMGEAGRKVKSTEIGFKSCLQPSLTLGKGALQK